MMTKNVIIGGISNYTYDHVKYWINSIKKTDFDGDIVLVATDITKETIEKLKSVGVILHLYGKEDYEGNYRKDTQLVPHVERFYQIWNFLRMNEYNYIVCTDVRDVIFQSNPIAYMETLIKANNISSCLISAGEGLKYKDEPWGRENFQMAFGHEMYDRVQYNEIFNVGILAGTNQIIQDLLLLIYQMSINRPINIVDQAVYNFIITLSPFLNSTILLSNDSGWAVNLGTTVEAIKSGSGDIGKINDPTSMILYHTKYLVSQPIIDGDVVYCAFNNLPSIIVHQYDRVAGLSELIKKKYEN
jgi:hypothetical protein